MRATLILVSLALIGLSAPALADCSSGDCIPGGGSAKKDCLSEFTGEGLKLNYPPHDPAKPKPKKELRCFDGDPGCDLDGEANGTCRFNVDVCLHNTDPNLPSCTPAPVSAVSVKSKRSPDGGQSLADAITALGFPILDAACTEGAFVDVPLKQKKNGTQKATKASIKVKATSSAGKDGDKVKLTCMPREWPHASYTQDGHRANENGTNISTANVATLVEKWTFDIPSPAPGSGFSGSGVNATPTVVGKLVYVPAWNGVLYAVDRKTGKEKWRFETGAVADGTTTGIQGGVTITPSGVALFGDSEANFYALDAAKGDLLWEVDLGLVGEQDHIFGSPVVANNRVFIGVASDGDQPCTKGRLYGLDLDTGEFLWPEPVQTVPDRICEDDTNFACTDDQDCVDALVGGACVDAVGGGVTAAPAVNKAGDTVYFVSVGCFTFPSIGNSDSLFSVDAATGAVNWVHRATAIQQFSDGPPYGDYGFISGPVVVDELVNGSPLEAVIAAGKDGVIYARDANDGGELWETVVGDVSQANDQFAGFGLFNGAPAYSGGGLVVPLHEFLDGTPAGLASHHQAYGADDGLLVWDSSEDLGKSWSTVSIANGVVYTGQSGFFNGALMLFAFDAATGEKLAELELPNNTVSGPSVVGDELFIGYGAGSLFSGSTGRGGVRAYQLP